MSNRTKYLLQGLFFLILGVFCAYAYFSGKSADLKKFTGSGVILSIFVGLIFLKNALKK